MADDTAAPIKPGWKTTEFWLHLLVTVCGLIMASGLPSSNKAVQIAGMVLAGLTSLGYGTQRTIAKISSILLIAFLLSGCKTINKDALAAWTNGDAAFMQMLEEYRAAQGKPADDIKAHIAKPFDQITAEEENALLTELLADLSADQKAQYRSARISPRVTAHLNLYHSLKGN